MREWHWIDTDQCGKREYYIRGYLTGIGLDYYILDGWIVCRMTYSQFDGLNRILDEEFGEDNEL